MNLLDVNDRAGEYPPSYYAASADLLPPFDPLDGEARAEVCVIGGGYTGLSAALHLAERGLTVRLVEAQRVGWGASGRNGGQLGTGQRRGQDELEARLGGDHARALWDIAEAAKDLSKTLIARHAIACDLKPGVLHADLKARFVPHSRAYAGKLQAEYAYPHIRFVGREEICAMLGTRAYHGGTLDMGAAHLHPLNYALGLARAAVRAGAVIHERTRVLRIVRGSPALVETDRGPVRADHVIVACNGYLGGLEDEVAAHVMPINNFILATEPLGESRARAIIRDDVAVADSKFVINYFRFGADHRLIWGGGETYGYRFPRDLAAKPRAAMLRIYPDLADARVDFAWGGTLAITVNRLPDFRRLAPNILSAGGYSGHGVALATMAGAILAETAAGTAGRFDVMAKVPKLRFPGGAALRTPLLVLAMLWYRLRDLL
jgi:gamma-glutamylputrescine oxidase